MNGSGLWWRPHATNTNPPEVLKAAYELAERYDVPYTLHVSEMDYELEMFREKYDQTPAEFLLRTGRPGRGPSQPTASI